MNARAILCATIVGGMLSTVSEAILLALMSLFVLPMTEHGLAQHENTAIWLIAFLLLLISIMAGKRTYLKHVGRVKGHKDDKTAIKLPNQAL